MHIEKRGNTEYLIGAPAAANDCGFMYEYLLCCHHVDGQHVATAEADPCGAKEILGRWPIESTESQPAITSNALRFMSPERARSASAPHVRAEADRINAELAAGIRHFVVNAPLFEEVERGMTSAGWVVLNDGPMHGRVSFEVRERAESKGER